MTRPEPTLEEWKKRALSWEERAKHSEALAAEAAKKDMALIETLKGQCSFYRKLVEIRLRALGIEGTKYGNLSDADFERFTKHMRNP